MQTGKILKNISNQYTVLINDELIVCTPRGKFRATGISPFVGDEVVIDKENKVILEIKPRKNELNRPLVANIDYALIVASVKEPNLDLFLLDKLITNVYLHKITPVICFTKLDLLKEDEETKIKDLMIYYEKNGVKAFNNTQINEITSFLKGKTVCLTGQSGAGKSSLLNKIDSNLNLKTDAISLSLNRGKHTTRHSEIIKVKDVYFLDTPGFSSLDIKNYSIEEVKSTFNEFLDCECRFNDCKHLKEMMCGVKDKVEKHEILESRYLSYTKIMEELNANSRFLFKK